MSELQKVCDPIISQIYREQGGMNEDQDDEYEDDL